jgi:hypothetical protein
VFIDLCTYIIYDIGYRNIGSTTAVNVPTVFAEHKYQVQFLRERDAMCYTVTVAVC